MSIDFGTFCELLEAIQNELFSSNNRKNSRKIRTIIEDWTQKTVENGIPLYHWVSLMKPEEDVDRIYSIREARLLSYISKVFNWTRGSDAFDALENWQRLLSDEDLSAADFGLRFCKVATGKVLFNIEILTLH
jgi:hypothetical protein